LATRISAGIGVLGEIRLDTFFAERTRPRSPRLDVLAVLDALDDFEARGCHTLTKSRHGVVREGATGIG
jgi:hypothetical protein